MNLIRPTYIPPSTSSDNSTTTTSELKSSTLKSSTLISPKLKSSTLTSTSLSNKTKTSNSLSLNEGTNIALNPAYKIDCSKSKVKLENRLENKQTEGEDINKEKINNSKNSKNSKNDLISSSIITNILEYIDSYLPPVKYVYTDGLNRNKINKEKYWEDIVNLFGLEHKEELPNTADAVFGASIQNLHNGKIKPVLFQASKAKIAFIKSASKTSVGGTSYSAEIIPREVCIAFLCGVYVDLEYLNSLEYQECLQSLSWLIDKSETSKSETSKVNKNIKDLTEEEIKTIIAICYEFYRFKIN